MSSLFGAQRPWFLVVAATLGLTAGCAAGGAPDPCEREDCSSRGFCITEQGRAYCACLVGYHPVALACEPDDPSNPCRGVDCTGHGRCVAVAGRPECLCDPGYYHPRDYLLQCVPGELDATACEAAGPELCNLRDDDCDGLTDEDGDCSCTTAADCADDDPCTDDRCVTVATDLRCSNPVVPGTLCGTTACEPSSCAATTPVVWRSYPMTCDDACDESGACVECTCTPSTTECTAGGCCTARCDPAAGCFTAAGACPDSCDTAVAFGTLIVARTCGGCGATGASGTCAGGASTFCDWNGGYPWGPVACGGRQWLCNGFGMWVGL